ncbi:unnamed protein product [Caenorhabditis bovis]|uniref:Transmembrane protein 231 n=1 Tax=Caenorhabditis bovis TaxID=2654633 RepID=A0A8S1F0T2_9PELO|nr:unnamed protein product [Caenorhabditis bovis]
MVHEDVFIEPVYRTYRAPPCSWAIIYIKIINIFKYLLPLIVIFATEGIWKKTGTYREIPKIEFNGNFIAYGYGPDSSIVASSYPVLNSAASAQQLSTARVSHHFENDENDQKLLNLDFVLNTQNLSLNAFTYGFVFDFKLDYHSIIEAELMLTDTVQLAFPTSEILVTGRLGVDQSIPFIKNDKWKVINNQRLDVEHYQIMSILERDTRSPIKLEVKRKSTIFLPQPHPTHQLSLNLRLFISELEFTYKTGIWELLKWAWIQYFSIYIIFASIFNSISSFLFRTRVIYATDSFAKYTQ